MLQGPDIALTDRANIQTVHGLDNATVGLSLAYLNEILSLSIIFSDWRSTPLGLSQQLYLRCALKPCNVPDARLTSPNQHKTTFRLIHTIRHKKNVGMEE
jgi:hypothetical protein